MSSKSSLGTGVSLATTFAVGLGMGPAGAIEAARLSPLQPPATGSIPVAFLLSEGATMIDFAGPWEVFQDTMLNDSDENAFRLYTVSETQEAIRTSGGMRIVPEFTFSDAPPPKIIVIPAQAGYSDATREWLRRSAPQADVVMSVCTGAFLLASTGLLDGMPATTHHLFYDRFQERFPAVTLERGRRFVENEKIASAGGLTSGIDLALRVVERYFGRPAAERTADYMEYQGDGWRDASGSSNAAYAKPEPTESRQE